MKKRSTFYVEEALITELEDQLYNLKKNEGIKLNKSEAVNMLIKEFIAMCKAGEIKFKTSAN